MPSASRRQWEHIDSVRMLSSVHHTPRTSVSRSARGSVSKQSSVARSPQAAAPSASREHGDRVVPSHSFEARSRCVAAASDGHVWTGEADGTITVRVAPLGYSVHLIGDFNKSLVLTLLYVEGRMWAGYNDGIIRVFDAGTLELKHQLMEHASAVQCMAHVGGYVYTGGADRKVHQWDALACSYRRLFHGHSQGIHAITGMVVEPETGGCFVFSGSDDGTVKVWCPQAPQHHAARSTACVATLASGGKAVLCLAVVNDARELWAGCEDGTIAIWDARTFDRHGTLEGHSAPVSSMAALADTVWSASKDGKVAVWDVRLRLVVDTVTSGSTFSGMRFATVVLPVFHTVQHHVWGTAPDGSWKCWTMDHPPSFRAADTAAHGGFAERVRAAVDPQPAAAPPLPVVSIIQKSRSRAMLSTLSSSPSLSAHETPKRQRLKIPAAVKRVSPMPLTERESSQPHSAQRQRPPSPFEDVVLFEPPSLSAETAGGDSQEEAATAMSHRDGADGVESGAADAEPDARADTMPCTPPVAEPHAAAAATEGEAGRSLAADVSPQAERPVPYRAEALEAQLHAVKMENVLHRNELLSMSRDLQYAQTQHAALREENEALRRQVALLRHVGPAATASADAAHPFA